MRFENEIKNENIRERFTKIWWKHDLSREHLHFKNPFQTEAVWKMKSDAK